MPQRSSSEKVDSFITAMQEEFISAMRHCAEVAHGRQAATEDLYGKILQKAELLSFMPGVEVVAGLAAYAGATGHAQRQESKAKKLVRFFTDNTFITQRAEESLRVKAYQVAVKASRRYAYAIDLLDGDDVVTFAEEGSLIVPHF